METEQTRILLVEDTPIYVRLLQKFLINSVFLLETAGSLHEGIEKTEKACFSLVLLDLGLPDSQGLNTLSNFKNRFPDIPVVILTGLEDEQLAAKSIQLGAQDYIVKGPYLTAGEAGKTLLLRSIQYSIERHQIQASLLRERNLLEKRVSERTAELRQANQQLVSELTERKRIEKALRESQANTQALISAMPDLICRVNQKGIVLDLKIPQAFMNIFPEIHIGESVSDVFPPDLIQKGLHSISETIQTAKPQGFEYDWDSGGKPYNFEIRVVESEPNEFLIIIRDRTEEKANETMWRRYEFIANSSHELMTLIDKDYRYQAVNDAFCQAQNNPREFILGKTVGEIWGKLKFETEIKPQLDKGFAGKINNVESWAKVRNVGRRYLEITYYPFFNLENLVTHVVVVTRDNTDRRIAEENLAHYYERLNILSEIDRSTQAEQTAPAIVQTALQLFSQLVPYDEAEVFLFDPRIGILESKGGFPDRVETPTPDLRLIRAVFTNSRLKKGNPILVNDLGRHSHRSPFEDGLWQKKIQSYCLFPLIAEGVLIGILYMGAQQRRAFGKDQLESTNAMVSQLEKRLHNAQLFDQVQAASDRLRYLTAQLVSAQEDERRRISLELHDEAGQAMTALQLNLGLIHSSLPNESVEAAHQIRQAINLTEMTMEKIRLLAHNLRPPALDAVGLSEAMEDLCQKVSRQARLEIAYSGTDVTNLPDYIKISLYRVLQEALTNVMKHAQASLVIINFQCQDNRILLTISDNGKGFNKNVSPDEQTRKGIGLMGMQERIEALGGKFEVSTQPAKGTSLLIEVPWGDIHD
ncbi:MAG: response regulator [Anaerolineaceae bacterium]|nr:response regulator [Anaerolineaceae bacterium]